MKAGEAPEKIWLGKFTQNLMLFDPNSNIYVEYTRTDVFIEKACEYWYQYNRDIIKRRCGEFTVHVEDFRKYLED